ncbi:MAG: hypothetical protein KF872_05355 [Chitinophagales bacterium]|nr:hypothetical protein [Chitinophagales bacterium]
MSGTTTGQMFTHSYLRKTKPVHHFLLALAFGVVGMAAAKLVFASQSGIGFMGCFGLLFYAMFNPWLVLLMADMKRYFLVSLFYYSVLALVMFGTVYLLTGESILNDWGLKITLISSTFFYFVAFGMMWLTKTILDDDGML